MKPTLPLCLALFLALACRREEQRVLPADEPARPVVSPRTHIADGELLPEDAVAEALLNGAYCYPLPGAARHSLWWNAETARLEFTEQADDGHWQRVAVLLPTGVSVTLADAVDSETGLPPDATPLDLPSLPQPPDKMRLIHTPLGQTWLVRADDNAETLLEPTRAGPVPQVTVTHASFQAAVNVPGGVLAALLRQDTDGDGQASDEDESDLCLVARAVTPVQVTERHVPLARLAVAEAVRKLAESTLTTSVVARWRKQEHRLQLRYRGACKLDEPAVTDALVGLHDAVTRVVGEVDLSLEVRCEALNPP